MRLNVRAFALTFAVWWGVGIFLGTWWVIAISGVTGEPTFLARVYFGYEISPLGSIIGLAWGAIDGLIAGAIFAWLYNIIATSIFSATVQKQAEPYGTS